MAKILVGVSGWTYEPWRNSFYPEKLKQKDELHYASTKLTSIEVNGTFYAMLKPANYASWYQQTEPGFVLALKAPKYITHVRRLKEFATPLANFLASGILALKEKLGPILWQFPPNLKFDPERFEAFMAALPHDTVAAAELAKSHSDWMAERVYLVADQKRPLRHAIEARHASFKVAAFVEMARRYGVAIVVGDTAGRWPLIEDVTADFVYLRMHCDETVYENGYTKEALERWATKYETWTQGKTPEGVELLTPAPSPAKPLDVFAYFDNDSKDTAPFNAMAMLSRLRGESATELQPAPAAKALVIPKVAAPRQPKTPVKRKTAAETAAKPAAKKHKSRQPAA